MAYRRKRRFRGSWVQTQFDEEFTEPTESCVIRSVGITAPASGRVEVEVGVVVQDNFPDPGAGVLLNDTMQGGWALRRIVGNAFVSAMATDFEHADENPALSANPSGVAVTLGFFVARTDQPGDVFPIGATDAATLATQYNPQHPVCNTEPWIWRRTWLLGLGEVRTEVNRLIGLGNGALGLNRPQSSHWECPPSNALYGSMSEGTKVDAKTRRRILEDERLYYALAARTLPIGVDFQGPASAYDVVVDAQLDLRCFGALRRRKNRSAF